jgi:hypothetical protein
MCQAYPNPASPMAVDMYPGTGFDTAPAYIPNDVLIPTLDDVTDGADTVTSGSAPSGYSNGNWTKTDLAYLDSIGAHWDFFMNTDNWDGPIVGDPTMDDPDGYLNFVDILKNHNPANHTVHHIHLGDNLAPDTTQTPPVPQGCDGSLTTVTCDQEMQGVESVVNTFTNGGRAHLTRMRPPYGEPYQSNGPGNLMDVEAVVAKYAVWVGWNLETHDADNSPCGCATGTNYPCMCVDETAGNSCSSDSNSYDNPMSVYNQVVMQVGAAKSNKSWGIVLMHGVLPWTAAAIPMLFGPNGWVKQNGWRVGSVEDAICWKYGMHSWDVVNKVNMYTGANARGPN